MVVLICINMALICISVKPIRASKVGPACGARPSLIGPVEGPASPATLVRDPRDLVEVAADRGELQHRLLESQVLRLRAKALRPAGVSGWGARRTSRKAFRARSSAP